MQHAPQYYNEPVYGQKIQLSNPQDDQATLLPPSTKKLIQKIIIIFLYYDLALDLTMLVTLGSLATQQSKPTGRAWDDIILFLNYYATHPSATIHYN